MKQVNETENQAEAGDTQVEAKAPKAPRVRKPKLDAEGNPIVKEAKAPKEPKPAKAPREIKDSTIAVVTYLSEALKDGPVSKRDLWKGFNETHPALIKPAAFGSIAKRSVYAGKFIVSGDKADALALRA